MEAAKLAELEGAFCLKAIQKLGASPEKKSMVTI